MSLSNYVLIAISLGAIGIHVVPLNQIHAEVDDGLIDAAASELAIGT
jgi:hypothetical protein